jgi:hypothetical protein
MTPSNIEMLLMVFGLLSLGGVGLIALKMILSTWIRRKEIASAGDVAKLAETVASLRNDTDLLRDQVGAEVADLHERLDFAERLLTRGSPDSKNRGAQTERTPI